MFNELEMVLAKINHVAKAAKEMSADNEKAMDKANERLCGDFRS